MAGTLAGPVPVAFMNMGAIGSVGTDTFDDSGAAYTGTIAIGGNSIWNYTDGRSLGNSITGTGSLTVNPVSGGNDIIITNVNTAAPDELILPTMGGFSGHLIIGGTLNNINLPVAQNATVVTPNASTITVNTPLSTGGGLTLLGGQLNVNQNLTAG